MSIKDTFRPIILIGSGINVPINRRVLVPLINIIILLVIINNTYKHMFI
jgi:hypothetical protein